MGNINSIRYIYIYIHNGINLYDSLQSTGDGSLGSLDEFTHHNDNRNNQNDSPISNHYITHHDLDDTNCASYSTIQTTTGEAFQSADDESRQSTSTVLSSSPHNQLMSLFHDKFTDDQLAIIPDLISNDFDKAMECLLTVPTLQNTLKLMVTQLKTYPVYETR